MAVVIHGYTATTGATTSRAESKVFRGVDARMYRPISEKIEDRSQPLEWGRGSEVIDCEVAIKAAALGSSRVESHTFETQITAWERFLLVPTLI